MSCKTKADRKGVDIPVDVTEPSGRTKVSAFAHSCTIRVTNHPAASELNVHPSQFESAIAPSKRIELEIPDGSARRFFAVYNTSKMQLPDDEEIYGIVAEIYNGRATAQKFELEIKAQFGARSTDVDSGIPIRTGGVIPTNDFDPLTKPITQKIEGLIDAEETGRILLFLARQSAEGDYTLMGVQMLHQHQVYDELGTVIPAEEVNAQDGTNNAPFVMGPDAGSTIAQQPLPLANAVRGYFRLPGNGTGGDRVATGRLYAVGRSRLPGALRAAAGMQEVK